VELNPGYVEAHNNLGAACKDLGRVDEAIACYRRALELKPAYVEAHWNLAFALLLAGDWQHGWPEYEWRWQRKEWSPRRFPQPMWDGASLAGKTILLHAEQGLGDTIQFIRYASIVKRHGAAVLVECPKPLLGVLEGCPGVDQWIAQRDGLPAFDVHAPLLSLPGILKTTVENIPAEIPYLFARPALIDRWRQALIDLDGFKIGIAWQGNPKYGDDRVRSIPLRCFAPLAQIPGVRLVSLQKGAGSEQLAEARDLFPVADFGDQLDQSGPFLDTAALMKNLDLVIAADTAAAHLAGALGVPVWLALPFMPEWRWLLDRSDTPWYPSMRLFRQKERGNWGGVFDEIHNALRERLSSREPAKHVAEDPAARVAESVAVAGKSLLDSGHIRLKRCRYGPMLYLVSDQYIGQSLDRYGEFSEGEACLFRQLIRPGWTILEIGANLGAHTIPLAKATGPQGVVHAFEPQRIVFQILCANVALNALSNVYTHHAAVGREAATIGVPKLDYTVLQNFGGVSLGARSEGEVVPVMTVDSLSLPACHMIKVDVEGMEGEVIAGAEQTIRRFRPVLYVENDREEKSTALIRQLLALDYRLYWHLPPLFNSQNYFGVAKNVFGRIVSANMLGFHRSLSQDISGLREITRPEDRWHRPVGT